MLHGWLRYLFFLVIVRPLVLLVLGVNIRHRERLPKTGPAILVANHNSHLDTLTLITLFPQGMLPRLRPVAAADYFLRTKWLAWVALELFGIIPLTREVKAGHGDPLAPMDEALVRGDILILYPEGSRGEPERMQALKTGIAHLAKRHPHVPIVPVYLHGLGKALPKGSHVLVPFFIDGYVGEPLHWTGERRSFMLTLQQRLEALAAEDRHPPLE